MHYRRRYPIPPQVALFAALTVATVLCIANPIGGAASTPQPRRHIIPPPPVQPIMGATISYTPTGRPIDPTRTDWLISQTFSQHIANEGVGTGALDFAFIGNTSAIGSPIYATEGGVVEVWKDRGDGTGYGNAVYIHGFVNPATGISYNTLYGHFSKVDVTAGQRVSAGDKLGEMGSTGFSTGPHVHYAVHKCLMTGVITIGMTNPAKWPQCEEIDPAPFIGQ